MDNTKAAAAAAAAAPTGCFKCGRPGHWSRDCPSSSTSTTTPSAPSSSNLSSTKTGGVGGFKKSQVGEKPKKVPRTRPKLTPELLLSDKGIGFVLRHFPRSFRYRGRGHEVSDLGNLIRLYSEWHSQLLPYYSFDQFVHKVEQVAATKRVKTCIRELRERVATGGDPAKLHDAPKEHDGTSNQEAPVEAMSSEVLPHHQGDWSSNMQAADSAQEDLLNHIYENATEVPFQALHSDLAAGNQLAVGSSSYEVQITEEQRARMEANRLKALERAAARSKHSSHVKPTETET